MMKLTIPDMSCGHCVKTITETIIAMDADAQVNCDLGQKLLTVDTKTTQAQLIQALAAAGYPATV